MAFDTVVVAICCSYYCRMVAAAAGITVACDVRVPIMPNRGSNRGGLGVSVCSPISFPYCQIGEVIGEGTVSPSAPLSVSHIAK
jgi:hypothetical protein